MAAPTITLPPLPGVGFTRRFLAAFRGLISRRLLLRLAGVPVVQLEGRVIAVRPVPLGVARELVPALLRCARRFSAWEIDEALYADFVLVLAAGLRLPPTVVERITVPLWELAPVIERIAQVNGMPTVEAGGSDLGKLLQAMTSNGTRSSPGWQPAPAGPGTTSSNA